MCIFCALNEYFKYVIKMSLYCHYNGWTLRYAPPDCISDSPPHPSSTSTIIYIYALDINQKTKKFRSILYIPVTPRVLGIQRKQFLESCLPTAPWCYNPKDFYSHSPTSMICPSLRHKWRSIDAIGVSQNLREKIPTTTPKTEPAARREKKTEGWSRENTTLQPCSWYLDPAPPVC